MASVRSKRSLQGVTFQVSSNGRYFIDNRGEPFFYLGDTAWSIFKRLDRDEVEVYLQNRIAKGFTVIQAYVLRGLQIPNLYGELTLINGDPTTPNEAYFKNVDFVVNRANELGLMMALVTSWGEHVKQAMTKEQIFTAENAFAFGRYLANRYRNNAVMWLLGGDRVPEEGKEVWHSMAKGLKEGSKNTHLVSYHGPGIRETPSSSYWFHTEPWLDFNTIQSGHGWTIPNYDFISHDYGLQPIKPTLDMEARYENHPDVRCKTYKRMNGHQVREAAYWALLAGAAGHGYGCNDIWQFFDEDRTPHLNDRTYPNNYPNTNWHQAMDFEGACSMKWVRKLFSLRPWYRLVPDQSILVKAVNEGEDHTQAARAEDGSFILAYLPFGTPVLIRLTKLTGKHVKALWYNPKNGQWIVIGQLENNGIAAFCPPTSGKEEDWILVLENAEKQYPLE